VARVKNVRRGINLDRLAGRLRKETEGDWRVQKRIFFGVLRLKRDLIEVSGDGHYRVAIPEFFDLGALQLAEPASGEFPTLATIEAAKAKIVAESRYISEKDFEMLGWGVHSFAPKFRVALLPFGWKGKDNGELRSAETHAILIASEWETSLPAQAQMETVEISALEKDYFYTERPDTPVRYMIHHRLTDEHMASCLE